MEYRISGRSKAFVYIFGAAGFGFGILGIYMAFHLGNPGLLIPSAFGLGIGWLMYRTGSSLLLTIDENSITLCNGFSTKSVLLDEIAGFRSGNKNALVLVLKNGEKPLALPANVERWSELRDWVKGRYPDIDAQLAQKVTEEVLHDERYGLTEEDRGRGLAQARKLMKYSTAIALFLLLFVVLSPSTFKVVMLVLLALPFVTVWLTWHFKGILRLYSTKSKPYPTLLLAVVFSEMAASAAVLIRYDIYLIDGRFWGLIVMGSVVVFLVWALACREAAAGEKNLFAVYVGMFLLAGVYSFDVLLFSNCEYDRQPPVITRVGIEGKSISHGRSDSYYLDLSPWGRFAAGKSVQVSHSFYNSVNTGDSVSVFLHPGKWGIGWYEVYQD